VGGTDKQERLVWWYCHKCKHEWKGVRPSSRQRRRSKWLCPRCGTWEITPGLEDVKWPDISRAIRNRDNNRCVLCGANAQSVHHIQPVSEGGESFATNLVSLCYRCHRKAHYGLGWWLLLLLVPILGWGALLVRSIVLLIQSQRQRQKLRDIAEQRM